MENYQRFLAVAKKAAIAAGELVKFKFGNTEHIKHKGDRDLVTDADFASERMIISIIKEAFPHHSILAEESGESGEGSEFTWAIDPVDGTNNFAYGMPLFGISIALLKGKAPVMGVINLPMFGELYHAVRGGGAFRNGKRIHVSPRGKLEDQIVFYHADLVIGKKRIMSIFDQVTDEVFTVRMLGAAVMHLTQIARGSADAWIELNSKPWDIAAGCLLVEEAGGKVTDIEGNPWSPWSKNLLVSNGKAHDELLAIIKKAWD